MENNYLLIKIKIIIYKMNKPFISFLLILSLFSSNFSKKLTIFAEEEIISTSFEDGDISMFTPRGEYDAYTLTLKKDGGNKGSNYLWISDRKETWNGAQFSLEGKCKEGEQYKATVAVKASSGNICLSIQHTDSSGEDHYNNLQCIVYRHVMGSASNQNHKNTAIIRLGGAKNRPHKALEGQKCN